MTEVKQSNLSARLDADEGLPSSEEDLSVLPPAAQDPAFLTPAIYWGSLAVITTVGGAMRFTGLASEDLWFDEVQTYIEAIWNRPEGHSHWLFYPIISWALTLLPDPTLAVRIYPALLGVLTIPLTGVAAGRLLGRSGGLLAALLVMMQPFHLIYSQEARFYAPMMFYTTALLGCGVLLATVSGWQRWLSLPAAGFCGWLLLGHHPTTAPVVLFAGAWFLAALGLSHWGFLLISRMIPALRRLPWARLILLMIAIIAGALAFALAGRLREMALEALFRSPWGETPNVRLTVGFFSRHLYDFAWSAPVIGVFTSALFCILGLGFLTWKRPWFALLAGGAIAATFLAIFAVSLEKEYLRKYGCAMQPFFVLLFTSGAVGVLQLITVRPRLAQVAPYVFSVMAVGLVAGMTPPVSQYFAGYKMPLRAQLHWVNDNAPAPAHVYIHGHLGYLAMLYEGELDSQHTLHYLRWQRRKDNGRAEAEVLRGRAATGAPTFFAYAWQHDMPSALTEFLIEEAELTAQFPAAIVSTREGRLYKIPSSDEKPAMGLPMIAIDNTRRPELSPSGVLLFDNASQAEFAVDLEKGRRYAVALRGQIRAERPWIFSLRAPGSQPLFLSAPMHGEKEFEIKGVLKASENASQISLAQVLDDPAIQTGQGGVGIRSIDVYPLKDEEELDSSAAYRLPPLQNALQVDEPRWQSIPAGLFKRVPHAESEQSAAFQLTDLSARNALVIQPLDSVQEGEMVYVRTAIRPRQLAGYGGNAQILFLNSKGGILQARFLASPSWTYRYPVAMMRRWMLPGEGLYWFEGVRQAPKGASAMAIGYPVWQTDHRKYEEAENILEIAVLEYTSGVPQPAR